jgi:hypothetical protein
MRILLIIAVAYLLSTRPSFAGFVDHGVAVPAAESRGVLAALDATGKPVVVACSMDTGKRGWILVTDLDSGKSEQVWLPAEIPNSPAYAFLLGSDGRFYTAQGRTFVEFDIEKRRCSFWGVPTADQECYLIFVEGPDGRIWGGGYPGCRLISFDPKTRAFQDHGKMDPDQAYMSYLAFDAAGWLYCGIGSARYNIVAYNPATGERRQLVSEAERKTGYGRVFVGKDGKVYGHAGGQWYTFADGKATPIAERDAPDQAVGRWAYWDQVLNLLPDGRKVTAHDMVDRWMEITDASGAKQRVTFDYTSEGSDLRLLTSGPGGKLYGCSAHPSRFFTFDPATDAKQMLPGYSAWKGIAVLGDLVAGCEYQGGKLFIYDTTRPWQREGLPAEQNPRLAAEFAPEINLPGETLAHPDGRHLLVCGLPGYGYRGGGLGIYDMQTGEKALLTHEQLAPEQSTVALTALPNGDIAAGTTIEGGHGTSAAAREACVYVLDWATRTVSFRVAPVAGAQEIRTLRTGSDGMLYGIASPGELFVLDPQSREVVYRYDLSAYGTVAYHGMTLGPDGSLYVVITNALLRIAPHTFEVEKLADTPQPATGGIAIQGGRLYFISGSHLWSWGK